MTKKLIFLSIILLWCKPVYCQSFSDGDHWYNNPLGFDPINLHTKNGFLIPAIVVGIGLLVTQTDSQFVNQINYFNGIGISLGYKYPYTTLFQNNTGIQYSLRSWMSAGAEIGFYFTDDVFNKTTGISIRPFFRFYPFHTDDWRIYFESGGGFIYFLDQFPKPNDRDLRLGTNWNGITGYGLGGEINLIKNFSLLFGIRHIHISNGNSRGVERNPSHDSNGVLIGLIYR